MIDFSLEGLSPQELKETLQILETKKTNLLSLYTFLDKMEPKKCVFIDRTVFKLILNISTLISEINEELGEDVEIQESKKNN